MSLEGIADLPLHSGHVPQWLASIMKRLANAILEIMVDEFGPDKVVERLANPLWFQAFNNVIGMDWDSSGSTTVTTGILKEVTWRNPELGLLVLGGKGSKARRVPEEVEKAIDILGIPSHKAGELKNSSKLAAKVDTVLLQDGYTLYHHALIVSENGYWTIIQQGMNIESKMARRYHWLEGTSYTLEPHKAIAGYRHRLILNLTARESVEAQKIIVDLASSNPYNVVREYMEAVRILKGQKSLIEYITDTETAVVKKAYNKLLYYKPLPLTKSLLDKLRKIYEFKPRDLKELLLVRGVGPSTIRALALISDLIYNEPPSTRDPVNTPYDPFKYAYAIGGKDGIPYPVNKKEAYEVILTLEDMVKEAKLGNKEKILALKKLRKLRLYVINML